MPGKRMNYRSFRKKELPAPVEIPKTDEWSEEPAEWMLSDRGRKAIALANKMNKTTTGLYSSVPLICRGAQCKYHERCPLVKMNAAPYGEVCAIEANLIHDLYIKYCEELKVTADDFIDSRLVQELVDIDISLDRANRAIAVDGDFIQNIVIGVDNNGRPLKKPELHQAVMMKEKLQKRRDSILKQLMATREGKLAASAAGSIDTVQFAADLVARALELNLIDTAAIPAVIDIEPTETQVVREEE